MKKNIVIPNMPLNGSAIPVNGSAIPAIYQSYGQPLLTIEERRSFDEIISDAIEVRKMGDQSRWDLGDLAAEVEKSYGKDAVGEFSLKIGEKKTKVYQYRWVSSRFPDKDIRESHLSWSHYREAASIDDQDERYKAIRRAVAGDFTVEEVKMDRIHDQTTREVKSQKCSECQNDLGDNPYHLSWKEDDIINKKSFCSNFCARDFLVHKIDNEIEEAYETYKNTEAQPEPLAEMENYKSNRKLNLI